MQLAGKKILLGICGSIAAYKTILLCRLLEAAGAEVRCLLTESAKDFVPTLVLSTLSRHEVLSSIHTGEAWANHVQLGRWADVFLIAPATCNTIAKMAHGHCDNLLLAVYLSATCPVMLAPAMDEDMWLHAATKANLQLLSQRGNVVLPVSHGALGSGLTGHGRMAEPEQMMEAMAALLQGLPSFAGKRVLVTAGPTFEALDPVRFIGNHSSGKMGLAIAQAFHAAGAEVHLVLGPVAAKLPAGASGFTIQQVTTALEMLAACEAIFPSVDVAVMAAAVADYRPAEIAPEKIKKKEDEMVLRLVKNPDILATLGKQKRAGQSLIGFALETNNGLAHARQKLINKNADYILLNSPSASEATGFGFDTNELTLVGHDGFVKPLGHQSKTALAAQLVQFLAHEKVD